MHRPTRGAGPPAQQPWGQINAVIWFETPMSANWRLDESKAWPPIVAVALASRNVPLRRSRKTKLPALTKWFSQKLPRAMSPCPVHVALTSSVPSVQPVGLPAASNVQRVTGTVPLEEAVV